MSRHSSLTLTKSDANMLATHRLLLELKRVGLPRYLHHLLHPFAV